MNEDSAEWSVRDLADLAGTTVRTIHYYVSEGLLPPPNGTTRSASYSPAHLARLRLIAALRDEGLALASIRQRLAPLTDEQVVDVATELDQHMSQPDNVPLTTLGLIEAALTTRINTDSPAPLPPATRSYSSAVIPDTADERPGRPLRLQESASDYLRRIQQRSVEERQTRPTPMPRPQPLPRKPADSDRPEVWYQYHVTDGIELRVREDRYRESKGRLRAVIDTMRASLRRYGLSPDEKDR